MVELGLWSEMRFDMDIFKSLAKNGISLPAVANLNEL